jgi:hypothetical protein
MVMDQKNILKDLEHNKNLVKENKLTVEQNKYKKNRKEQKCYKSFKDLVDVFNNKEKMDSVK